MNKFIEDDDDRILKDGETLTVKMYMKDGSPKPGFSPLQRAIAAATHDAVTFDARLHQPGYRHGTNDAAPLNDAQRLRYGVFDAAKERAYADRDRDLTNSWRGSKSPPTGSYPEGTSHEGDNNRPDTQQTMDAAYSEYDLRIQNSWRNQS
jgi:hypothetical protein